MPTDLKRPTTVEAIVAAVKRESSDQLRLAVLIMLMVLIGALGLSLGYLIGTRNVDAAAVEAAGTWFGALVTLAAVIIAARVFLSDKLFQDYQLAADRERERDERALRNRSLLAQARMVTIGVRHSSADTILARPPLTHLVVHNKSEHTMAGVEAVVSVENLPVETPSVDAIYPRTSAALLINEGDGAPTDDLVKTILRETTLTFSQNGHKWIKHGEQDTELVE